MKSLEILEELNKILIDANKRCDIAYENVGEQDKLRSDLDHDLLNTYKNMTAKEKREYTEKYFECLADRHNYKYEYRELEILKELYNTPQKLETAFNSAINIAHVSGVYLVSSKLVVYLLMNSCSSVLSPL